VTDVLLRLQSALPRVAGWIDDLHATHASLAVPTADLGFQALPRYFPATVLRNVRAVTVDRIPFPPVSAYGLPEFESMASMAMAGITFRGMYFVHGPHSSEAIHCHELVHTIQWRTLGLEAFLSTYAVGILQHGYPRSPLESMAFDLQAQFERQVPVASVLDVVVRHTLAARDAAAEVFRANGLRLGA
jgi:hypothetical protein